MSEENKVAVKEKASEKKPETKWSKFVSWVKRLPKTIATPFKNMADELKRVTWPTKHKLIVYSVTVLVFMVVMMVVIGLLDTGATALVKLLV